MTNMTRKGNPLANTPYLTPAQSTVGGGRNTFPQVLNEQGPSRSGCFPMGMYSGRRDLDLTIAREAELPQRTTARKFFPQAGLVDRKNTVQQV